MPNLVQGFTGEADKALARPPKWTGLRGVRVERSDPSQCFCRPRLLELAQLAERPFEAVRRC